MSYKPSLALLALGALMLSATGAQAQTNVISFSFSGNANTPAFVNPALPAGVFPAKNFNHDNGGNIGSVTNPPGGLAYANGTSSGTTLTYNAPSDGNNSLNTNPNYSTDGNQQLMNGFIQSGAITGGPTTMPGSASVTVSSIPYASYSLYVYTFDSVPATGTFVLTPGGIALATSQTAMVQGTFDPNNPFKLATANSAGDYLLFTGLTASSFTLSASNSVPSVSGTPAVPIDGFQLVATPAAVPEASTTISFGLLLALGLGGFAVAHKKSAANAS